jgi:hypothetical protein
MRIRKRNRFLRRVVLGFALVALVVPSAAMARVDEGLGASAPTGQGSYTPFVTDFPKYDLTSLDQGGVQLADPKYGQTSSDQGGVQLADPKYGQTSDVARHVQLADPKFGQQTVELGTYGLPHAGLNDYLSTHSGKAMVSPRNDVSTPQVVSSDGFDWSDAGIGAGILAGLMAVIGAAGLAARQIGRPQTA